MNQCPHCHKFILLKAKLEALLAEATIHCPNCRKPLLVSFPLVVATGLAAAAGALVAAVAVPLNAALIVFPLALIAGFLLLFTLVPLRPDGRATAQSNRAIEDAFFKGFGYLPWVALPLAIIGFLLEVMSD